MRWALPLFLLLLWAGAARAELRLSDPAAEARAQTLTAQLRCMVCENESLNDSPAELAVDLRRLVREEIAAGKSDAEIKDYLQARYGTAILLHPPLAPATLGLWLMPWLVLLAGGIFLGLTLHQKNKAKS